MVLQKVVVEGQLEVTDTLIDDNNSAIQVGHWWERATFPSFLDPRIHVSVESVGTGTLVFPPGSSALP